MELVAFDLMPGQGEILVEPAELQRGWMDAMPSRAAHRCLPLLIANQAGWWMRLPTRVEAVWNGGDGIKDCEVTMEDPRTAIAARSHFGYGIVTFNLPYLFRTPPGLALWVKGPANWPKRHVYALEGVVETDWSPATFTMNWQILTPHEKVVFEAGEPICMVLPVNLGQMEALEPAVQRLNDDPEFAAEYRKWRLGRADLLQNWGALQDGKPMFQWQGDYIRGEGPGAENAQEHRTRLKLRKFERRQAVNTSNGAPPDKP